MRRLMSPKIYCLYVQLGFCQDVPLLAASQPCWMCYYQRLPSSNFDVAITSGFSALNFFLCLFFLFFSFYCCYFYFIFPLMRLFILFLVFSFSIGHQLCVAARPELVLFNCSALGLTATHLQAPGISP